jgi:ribose/xylose/arabinose/galactoside ABC-type transport system permease subunit
LLWFACLVPLLAILGMLCNLSLRAWTFAFHRQMLSIYGKARLICLLATGCTLWILLREIFCSPPFHSLIS